MINPALLNIGGNRVWTEKICVKNTGKNITNSMLAKDNNLEEYEKINEGRYPAQSFVDDDTALILDKQSGMIKGDKREYIVNSTPGDLYLHNINQKNQSINRKSKAYNDTGGCSKILQKIKKDENE